MKIQLRFLWILLAGIFLNACQKFNQIDNSSTVKTPYVLYIGGFNGTLHKTNDALYFNTLFPTDNSCVRQIVVADTNLLYLKQNFYFSKDDGKSFKRSNDHPIGFMDLFYKYYLPNSSLYDQVEKRVYLVTNNALEYSTDLGENFSVETNFDTPPAGPPTSITQQNNGLLYLMIDSANQYKKSGTGQWTQVLQTSADRLPTDTTTWYIAHTHDTLIAIDFNGKAGVWYSTNEGTDWFACGGQPKNRKILFGNEAYGSGTFFIGFDSAGLYRLDGTTFNATSAGIPWYAKVSYVEGKRVVYRTDVTRYYMFAATDQGLFISETNGFDWKLLRSGNYSTLK
ncbi:MAG: hypothetical protein JNJ58_07015 [Chitinophagaceae bacterium]|nr:hypothetical protein [Chitinophagaceae bacterium]